MKMKKLTVAKHVAVERNSERLHNLKIAVNELHRRVFGVPPLSIINERFGQNYPEEKIREALTGFYVGVGDNDVYVTVATMRPTESTVLKGGGIYPDVAVFTPGSPIPAFSIYTLVARGPESGGIVDEENVPLDETLNAAKAIIARCAKLKLDQELQTMKLNFVEGSPCEPS